MAVWLITRHSGTVEWCAQQGLSIDQQVAHLQPEKVFAGDVIIGTLPIHLIADITQKGARYLHLSLDLPEQWRGQELTPSMLDAAGARLEEYSAHKL
ncbi:CRISPR-associated protein Csx16 [Vibrio metschnikovii]|uniref:CRISPR-associated protein Csx16 n=1 Tax=Vibrio metschnikovii TaxID=28172 RepID=UPI001C30F0E9|nr:CRISPR-associated protein Csx16 [Vibrio metschnikovii]